MKNATFARIIAAYNEGFINGEETEFRQEREDGSYFYAGLACGFCSGEVFIRTWDSRTEVSRWFLIDRHEILQTSNEKW